MKVGIYSNPVKDPGNAVGDKIANEIAASGAQAVPYSAGERFDLVVTVGGDGTILRIAKDCARFEVPILGVNLGTVGFLTEVEPDGFAEAFDKIRKRDFLLERRALLEATAGDKKFHALNDVVVMRAGDLRMITMEVRINDELIDKFSCDGYIACTPTGSTAYSMSAGGSVISPNTPVIGLTPINPHTLRTRPIVVGSFEKVEMSYTGPVPAVVNVDGEHVADLAQGEKVTVTGWDRSALFVRFGKKSFYSRLLGKLNSWSAGD